MSTLPSPEALRAYEDIRPGLAARILAMAERELDLAARHLCVDQRRGNQVHHETMICLKAWHKAKRRGGWMTFCLLCALPVLAAALAARIS